MDDIPQDCINSNCKNILYVSGHEIGLPLMCSECRESKSENYE